MNIRRLFFTTLMLFVHNLFAQVKESDLAAYLMVYFKDESHGLYVAVSQDGYSFTDINKGKPTIAGDSIAQQKGVSGTSPKHRAVIPITKQELERLAKHWQFDLSMQKNRSF